MSLIARDGSGQKYFPFCGEQMLKFLQKERGIKGVSRKLRPRKLISQTSDLENSDPSNFYFFFNIFIANSSQFLAPNVSWSHNVHREQPEIKKRDIYLLRFIAVALIKQWKTNKG